MQFLVERIGGGRARSEDKAVPPSFLLSGPAAALQDSLRDRLLWIRREVSDSRWQIEAMRFENLASAAPSASIGRTPGVAARADSGRSDSLPAEAGSAVPPGRDSVRLLVRVRDGRSMNSHGLSADDLGQREREQILEGFAPGLLEPLRAAGIREPVRVVATFRHRNFLRSSSRYLDDSAAVDLPTR